MENIKEINVNYNFTTDTHGFWDDCRLNRKGLGMFNNGCDPDSKSKTLQNYNKILYSRELPNKEIMKLDIGKSSYHYLTWKNFRFGSDIIFNNFCYERYPVIWEIKKNDLKKEVNYDFTEVIIYFLYKFFKNRLENDKEFQMVMENLKKYEEMTLQISENSI